MKPRIIGISSPLLPSVRRPLPSSPSPSSRKCPLQHSIFLLSFLSGNSVRDRSKNPRCLDVARGDHGRNKLLKNPFSSGAAQFFWETNMKSRRNTALNFFLLRRRNTVEIHIAHQMDEKGLQQVVGVLAVTGNKLLFNKT